MYIPSRFLFFIFHWHLNLQQLKISKIGKYARCFNRSNCRDSAFNELINISWSPYIYAYTGDVHKYIYIYIIHISYIYIYTIYIYIYIYIYPECSKHQVLSFCKNACGVMNEQKIFCSHQNKYCILFFTYTGGDAIVFVFLF